MPRRDFSGMTPFGTLREVFGKCTRNPHASEPQESCAGQHSATSESRGLFVSMWRFNLHATVSALAISPIFLGWAWGIPLLAPTEMSAGTGATRTAASTAQVQETAAPQSALEDAGVMLKV